ncbi:MAG: hypothetical protein SXV54_13570, partial [Chloroflexota bacterium]|nr:hypothetical protein [Chloroflexota bacterium]
AAPAPGRDCIPRLLGWTWLCLHQAQWRDMALPLRRSELRQRVPVTLRRHLGQLSLFEHLREREKRLQGRCGECEYRKLCGGCRGRAWAVTGDYLAEDPSCFIHPDNSA